MAVVRTIAAGAWFGLSGLSALAGGAVLDAPGPAAHGSFLAGHFRLAAPDGSVVDSDDLSGKPYGLFFGFTQCPDICPTTLAELSMALAQLPPGDIKIYFVSIDPERDTPEALATYMTSFDPRIVALSGSRQAVDEAVATFGAVAKRTDLPNGGYTYGHTASVLLIDGNGLVANRIGADAGPNNMAKAIAALAARSAVPSR